MTEQMEKLVGEIRLIWCEDCSDGPSRYEYCPDLDDEACEGGAETIKFCVERARNCVTRIGKAYADGELELPGEVGRTTREVMMGEGSPPNQMLHWWLDTRLKDGATEFIALRPPSGKEDDGFSQRFWAGLRDRESLVGTGKEEKK